MTYRDKVRHTQHHFALDTKLFNRCINASVTGTSCSYHHMICCCECFLGQGLIRIQVVPLPKHADMFMHEKATLKESSFKMR